MYDISPILERSTKYNVKGTLEIPYYPESDATDIEMAYATEFTDLTSSAGQFTNITLTGFLAGALTLVSRSLINNSQFDIVGFVVDHMRTISAVGLRANCSKEHRPRSMAFLV